MLYDNYDKLNEIRFKFQPYVKNPDFTYTFIGPKDKLLFDRFVKLLLETPNFSGIAYFVISNLALGKDILIEHFPDNTELEIYVSSKSYSNFCLVGTLKEYIVKEGLKFTIK